MKHFKAIISLLLLTLPARAGVHTEVVTYKDGDTVLEGFLAYDDRPILTPLPTAAEAAVNRKRPGILRDQNPLNHRFACGVAKAPSRTRFPCFPE